MSLKTKLVLLLLVSGITLALIFILGFRTTMIPSLRNQKAIFIEKIQKRIQAALAIEEENIATLCNEWCDWDSLIKCLKYHRKELEQNALPDAMFTDGLMDLVVILNMDQKFLFYKNFRPDKGFIDLTEMDISRELKHINRMTRVKLGAIKGVIYTPESPIMFVVNPILDRKNLNRREGVLIMGRYVDERMLKRFSSYTIEKIQTLDFNRHQLQSFFLKHMQGENLHYTEKKDEITIFHLLKDIYQKPAMVLFTNTDNRLFRVVNYHITTFLILTSVLIIFLGFMFYFAIGKYFIKRMLGISDRMSQIEGFNGLSIRIDSDNKNDEVSHLISNINRTLDRLEQEKVNREKAEKSMITHGKLASIGRLTSSIAHEINNPLMAIGTSIQVIKKISQKRSGKNGKTASLLNEAVGISESEVERIKVIISGLLDFHRLDKEEFSKVNLKNIILQSLSIIIWSEEPKGINIITKLDEDCFILGAPVKLKQVFINFLLNAIEAMGTRGGKLRVEMSNSSDGKFAMIHFKDNGPGLSGKVKDSLFEPFVTTKEDKGVGLGLYVSLKIIENHGGEIIYDEGYKEGTHFIIKLPLLKD
jgi:signal transduction histidine kinase